MKKGFFILIAVVIIVMSLGSFMSCSSPEPAPSPTPSPEPAPAPAEAKILKFASAATADYIPDEEAFVNTLNERLAPNYVVEYYPAGQMLAFPELLDGIRTGGAEMGATTPCFHSADEPALGVSELPFLFNNNDAHRMGTKGLEPLYAEILESKFNQHQLNLHNYMGMALISKTGQGTGRL
jgi:TRAP-type C4-dicarboxylate transport system substrate-binding protein